MKCISCEKLLERMFDDVETNYQFDNALWIGFYGGYGMFVDSIATEFREKQPVLSGAAEEAVLCHECAHELCEKVSWIGKLLKPELSHSHSVEYKKKHPNHIGWDMEGESHG